MQEYIDNNRLLWDGMVPVHVASDFYDLPSFRAGRSALLPVELDEVGPVRGRTLLHLQCHFGMDTLSWAREGAMVTGVDFSPEAIRVARDLAAELQIEARFIESDVYELPEQLSGQFDIVFASYGVICWLPDFPRWAEIAASYVKPEGFFYLIDAHPVSNALAEAEPGGRFVLDTPYFSKPEPVVWEDDGSYADRNAKLPHKRAYEFNQGLGEVVTSLIDAGLRVEFLHEFPFAAWPRFPAMTKGADGYYRLEGDPARVPFMFSVRATKPG